MKFSLFCTTLLLTTAQVSGNTKYVYQTDEYTAPTECNPACKVIGETSKCEDVRVKLVCPGSCNPCSSQIPMKNGRQDTRKQATSNHVDSSHSLHSRVRRGSCRDHDLVKCIIARVKKECWQPQKRKLCPKSCNNCKSNLRTTVSTTTAKVKKLTTRAPTRRMRSTRPTTKATTMKYVTTSPTIPLTTKQQTSMHSMKATSNPTVCEDSDSNRCHAWSVMNLCSDNLIGTSVQHKCPRSCGLCVSTVTRKPMPTSAQGCQDQAQYCQYWSQKMLCTDTLTGQAIQQQCPKSCGLC